MRATLAEGIWTWRPPIGYLADKGSNIMQVHPTNGEYVAELFERIAKGESKDSALEIVTATGLKYRDGQGKRGGN